MKSIFFLFMLIPFCGLSAQDILQEYISMGLKSNLALQQKESNYQKSLEALKEARGLFYPSVSLNARYTVSEGGRVIEFPVGDLLNPVYSTLNTLTSSNRFPVLENQQIAFLRPTEHETKLRLVQPVFNTDVYYNEKIRKELTLTEEISLEQYRRELTAEIKKAYYSVCMSHGLLSMLQETRLLLLENVRVNTSLVANNKVTRDILLRSQTELFKFDQQLQEARKGREVSAAYFNFLLNRPLTDSVIIEAPAEMPVIQGTNMDFTRQAIENREEIKNLEQYSRISNLNISMHKSGKLPDIMVVADYGFQGEKYVFNKNHDYLQASAVLSWDLFSGFSNRARIKQALISKGQAEQQLSETKSKIELQVINATEELKTSEAGLLAAEEQVRTAREGFRLVQRKYEEGQSNLIEFMDARNTLTQAEVNLIISKFTRLSDYAEFEKVVAVNPQ